MAINVPRQPMNAVRQPVISSNQPRNPSPYQRFPPRPPVRPPGVNSNSFFPSRFPQKPKTPKDNTQKILMIVAGIIFVLLIALVIYIIVKSGDDGGNDNPPECVEDSECSDDEVCSGGNCVASNLVYCEEGDSRECGSDIGECSIGTESCLEGEWSGVCDGEIASSDEICDSLDNDCDDEIDEDDVCDGGGSSSSSGGGGQVSECVINNGTCRFSCYSDELDIDFDCEDVLDVCCVESGSQDECLIDADCLPNYNCINRVCVSNNGNFSCLPGQIRYCERNGLVGFKNCLNGQWTVCNVSIIDHSSDVQEEFFVWGKNYTSPFKIGDKIYAREYVTSCNETSESVLKIASCYGIGRLQTGEIIDGPKEFTNPEWYKIEWDDGQKGWGFLPFPGGRPQELRSLPSYSFNIVGEVGYQGSGLSINGPARDILRDSFYHRWKVRWGDGIEGWVRDYDIGHYQEGLEDYYIKRLLTKKIGVNITSVGRTLSVFTFPHEKGQIIASKDSGAKGVVIGGPLIGGEGSVMYKARWGGGVEGWSVGEFLIMENYSQAISNIGKNIVSSGSSLSVRETPNVNGKLIASRDPGTRGVLIDGLVKADGYLWWKVRWRDGIEGWSAGIQLQKDGDYSSVQSDFLIPEKSVDWLRFGKGISLANGYGKIEVRLESSSDSEIIANRTRNNPLGTPLILNDRVTGHYVSKIAGPVRVFNEGKWWRRINWRQVIEYKGQENVLLMGWTEEEKLSEIVEPLKIGMRVHSTGYNLAIRSVPSQGGEWFGAAYGVGTITSGPVEAEGYSWWQVKWDKSGTLGYEGEQGWSPGKWLGADYYWTLA